MIEIKFGFYRFNRRRLMRGAEAVQMNMYEDGELTDCFWMSKKDILANMKEFGSSADLERGLSCYRLGNDIRDNPEPS